MYVLAMYACTRIIHPHRARCVSSREEVKVKVKMKHTKLLHKREPPPQLESEVDVAQFLFSLFKSMEEAFLLLFNSSRLLLQAGLCIYLYCDPPLGGRCYFILFLFYFIFILFYFLFYFSWRERRSVEIYIYR